jgi:hypothetical protein
MPRFTSLPLCAISCSGGSTGSVVPHQHLMVSRPAAGPRGPSLAAALADALALALPPGPPAHASALALGPDCSGGGGVGRIGGERGTPVGGSGHGHPAVRDAGGGGAGYLTCGRRTHTILSSSARAVGWICTANRKPSQWRAVPTWSLRLTVRRPTRTTQEPAGHGHVSCTCCARMPGGASSNTSRARWQFKKALCSPPLSGWCRRALARNALLIASRPAPGPTSNTSQALRPPGNLMAAIRQMERHGYIVAIEAAQSFQCEALRQRKS